MYDGKRQSSTILTVLGSDTDFGSLQSALHPQRTQLFRGRTLADARRLLASEPVDVVVTEDGLSDNSGWKDVLDACRSVRDARPVIVTSRCADEFLWAEVLNLGGFDVLKQPFEKEEVLWVLGSALRHRDRTARRGNTDSAVSAEDVDPSRERATVGR